MNAVIVYIIKQYFSLHGFSRDDEPLPASQIVSGAAGLLHSLLKGNEALTGHVVTLLTRSTIPSLDDSLAARRSVMAALAQDEGEK